jgi:hypothetical protein
MSPAIEMLDAPARGIVALVTDKVALGDWADKEFISEAMDVLRPAFILHVAISLRTA